MSRRLSSWRSWPVWIGLVLLVLLLLLVIAWAFRASLAEYATQKWCRSQDLTCSLQVAGVGLSGARVENFRIETASGEVPFEAEQARIGINWPGFLRPGVTLVELSRPTVRGRYDPEDGFTLGGLEKLTTGEGGSGTYPEMDIQDAQVELATPAGPVIMRGTLTGQLPYRASLEAEIEPVELETEDGRLVLTEGRADLELTGLKLSGEARFELAEARFDGVLATDVRLIASMADSLRPTINWTASAGQVDHKDIALSNAHADGSVGFAAGEVKGLAGPLARIRSASLTSSAEALRWKETRADSAELSLDAARADRDTMEVDFALTLSGLDRPDLTGRTATLTGEASLANDLSSIEATGDLVAEGAGFKPDFRASILAPIDTAAPLDRHADALRAALGSALADFSGGTGASLRFDGADSWSLVTTRAIAAKGADGTNFTLEPASTRPVLNLAEDGAEISGVLTLDGPQLPEIAADIKRAQLYGGPLEMDFGGVSVSPWTVQGRTLGGDLSELNISRVDSETRIRSVGEVRLQGELYGLTFAPTRLFGGIDAVAGEGVRVQTYSTRCLGFDTRGVSTSGGVALEPVSLQLCPRDGRVVRHANGASLGTIDLGDVSLPFHTNDTSGDMELDQAVLDWRAGKTANFDITASRMHLPLEIGSKSLDIAASAPKLGVASTSPASLTAEIGPTEFGGSMIPADMRLGSATFSATLPSSGIKGTALASEVRISDQGEDPLYEPMIGELTAEFGDGLMRLTGPVTTPRAGQTIATVSMTLDLLTLDGEAHLASARLVFAPGRFQPTALSERVRGFLSNARGTLQASADFTIDGGDPSGTGWVSVSDFGFDTLRVGAVNGVTGRVNFSDIMTLSTPPGQTVTIGQINPGIELHDGTISFQLTNGTEATIEEARWPFAGGELVLGRSEWTVAGTRDVIRIDARELELTQIVEAFQLPDIDARGTVSGAFPVEIVGPNAYIRDAVLKADDEGGSLAYKGDVGDAAAKADERVEMAFEALKDFRFSVLELGANGNLSGDILITLKLVGRSPEVLDGAPFAFNIGIDSKLMKLIRAGRRITTSDWLAEAVRGGGEDDTDAEPETE